MSVVMAACGSSGPTKASTPTSTAAFPPGSTVTVGEVEYKLEMPTTSFTAGSYTFDAVNKGKIPHALEITGPGNFEMKTGLLVPGQTAELSATLQPGQYDFFCPIPGHKALGMNQEVTVTAATGSGATTGATASPATTSKGSGGGYAH
jgi:plastocyanin